MQRDALAVKKHADFFRVWADPICEPVCATYVTLL